MTELQERGRRAGDETARPEETTASLTRQVGRAAVAGGVLGAASLVVVLVGEVARGAEFMGTGAATLAGWAGFAAGCLLVLGLLGVAVRWADVLSGAGRVALLVATLGATVLTAVSSTLATVVPALADRAPEVANNPPIAVPVTFIVGGLALGVASLVLAGSLRRAKLAPRWATVLLTVAAVVTIVPLPSRHFLITLALGLLLLSRPAARPGAESVH